MPQVKCLFSQKQPQRRRRPVAGSPSSSFHDRPREVREGSNWTGTRPHCGTFLRSITSQCQVHIHCSVLALALIRFSGLHARKSLVLCCVTRGCDMWQATLIFLTWKIVTCCILGKLPRLPGAAGQRDSFKHALRRQSCGSVSQNSSRN